MYHNISTNTMGIITGKQIATYFETYKSTEVTFTKQINQVFGLNPKQIFLKIADKQWPCIIFSSSMESVKILLNLEAEVLEHLESGATKASVRYSIKKPDGDDVISFFIPGKISSIAPYSKDNPTLNFVTLKFTQRPPDDLIEMLGLLLETAMNSQKRKEERIVISPNVLKLLGLASKEVVVLIQQISCKGIIRDLSFSGLKGIVVGNASFFVEKEAAVTIETDEKTLTIPGKIIRVDPVEGRQELASLSIAFDEDKVPIEYKMKLNDYFSSGRLEITPE